MFRENRPMTALEVIDSELKRLHSAAARWATEPAMYIQDGIAKLHNLLAELAKQPPSSSSAD